MSNGIIMGNTKGLYRIKSTITPAEVATIVTVEQTFTVTGLMVGDHVSVNPPGVTAGAAQVAARVSAADTLALTYTNPTAGNVTPLAGVHEILVSRPESGASRATIGD